MCVCSLWQSARNTVFALLLTTIIIILFNRAQDCPELWGGLYTAQERAAEGVPRR